ncbi:hypothetical protein [Roseiconus lacunae]|uniref:Uncharacterized protein n=1 Tax=Roseiconus lacunae TaxID=2605694 RepID=A0ABT7PEJ0_9BACT|nr:hypothetical protein [Roseiconus lacunae]MDM4014641.1 hypothetical protein [Roseiconus lacunae]
MLELGYAAAKLGWDRIVLVMNERYGGVSKLPFDLRNRRWPITYALSANQTQPAMLADDLSTRLAAMIGQSLASDYQRAEDAIAKLAPQARRLMKRLGANSALTDGGGENRSAVGRDEFYAQQLLNLGILRTTDADSNLQYQYTWTYLGRECCRRIGVAIPNEQSIPEFNQSKNVLTDLTAFDELEPADRSAHE